MISIKNLIFYYATVSEPALKDISFNVESGEIFGLLGPSGAGKSTMQKILIGLLKDYQGSVRLFNREISEWGDDLYERIGVVFELPNHYLKLTGLENLQYFCSLYENIRMQPEEALSIVGLASFGALKVSQYSKGMKTRLGIARALLHDPDILFLDEPTTGLDPVNARLIKNLIFDLKKRGKTIFLTTHNMEVADQLCDKVAFIIDGKIHCLDTPEKLKSIGDNPQVYVEYQGKDGRENQSFPIETLGKDQTFWKLLNSYPILSMRTHNTTLEDIFILVTGASLC